MYIILPVQGSELQFMIEIIEVSVNIPQMASIVAVTVYVPTEVNWWDGFKAFEILFVPLALSPKFQLIVFIVAPVINEKGILFCKQLSVVVINPSQHKPMDIILQIVVTGELGSWKVTQTL